MDGDKDKYFTPAEHYARFHPTWSILRRNETRDEISIAIREFFKAKGAEIAKSYGLEAPEIPADW